MLTLTLTTDDAAGRGRGSGLAILLCIRRDIRMIRSLDSRPQKMATEDDEQSDGHYHGNDDCDRTYILLHLILTSFS